VLPDVLVPVSPLVAPLPVPDSPELKGSEELRSEASPPPAAPSLDDPPLDAPLPVLPVPGALLLPPGVDGPPDVPPEGELGVAPGDSDGGGVVAAGADELGALLVPPVPPWSVPPPPPRLQAATLIVSKPVRMRIFEACSLEFIAIPFN
jgi:hypothetical protein